MKYLLFIPFILFGCKKETIKPAEQPRVATTEQLNQPPWKNVPKLDSTYMSQLFKRFGR